MVEVFGCQRLHGIMSRITSQDGVLKHALAALALQVMQRVPPSLTRQVTLSVWIMYAAHVLGDHLHRPSCVCSIYFFGLESNATPLRIGTREC